jgi:predicted secreted hydrolase
MTPPIPKAVAALSFAAALMACSGEKETNPQQDFAVLASADPTYAQAKTGRPLRFPEDHGPHPDFRIEWWYVTANLEDGAGRPWGLQWTLFRTAVRPLATAPKAEDNPWQSGQVYMAHFAVSSPDAHEGFQRYARGGDHGGIRQAGVDAEPFAAWLDDWRLESTGADWLPLRLVARQDSVVADLVLNSDRPLVRQGADGFSQKHPDGGGSYYYSQPWLSARGSLQFGGEAVNVEGHAWLDREWSSQFLQPDQQGWDWFALHLDNGDKLMAFQLRNRNGSPYRHAVLLHGEGGRRTAASDEVSLRVTRHGTVAGRRVPLAWRLSWAAEGLAMDIEAGLDDQWMRVDFPYWEGRVTVSGSDGSPLGVGYVEMTGYAREEDS